MGANVLNPGGNAFPWLLAPLLVTQGLWVRSRTPRLPEAAGPSGGQFGSGPVLRLVAIGDSIVAGVGVASTEQSLPARLAQAMAGRLSLNVEWSSFGRNGARTRDLLDWPAENAWRQADLVLLSNGLNDVTNLMAIQPWLDEKAAWYDRIQSLAKHALIAQLGLPPLGHFPALPQPLRSVLGKRAHAFDLALESLVEPRPKVTYLPFRTQPDPALFAEDGYHPGPQAVAIWADALAERLGVLLTVGNEELEFEDQKEEVQPFG